MTGAFENRHAWLEDPKGGRFPVGESCTLGRSPDNQICLRDDQLASREHALVQLRKSGDYWLIDLGSRNGTYLNGERILKPTPLASGDRVRIGAFEFDFRECFAAQLEDRETSNPTQITTQEITSTTCWLMVADIINSTALFQSLPPKKLPAVVGQWVGSCKKIIEAHQGRINQITGDGFFAFWRDGSKIEWPISRALKELQSLSPTAGLHFRTVVHVGAVTMGGLSLGEVERISGPEVHYVFRMEKLAQQLRTPWLLSTTAARRLEPLLTLKELGQHALPGFEETQSFYAC